MFEKMSSWVLNFKLSAAEVAKAELMHTNTKLKEENEKLREKNKQQSSMLQILAETIEEMNGDKNE